MFPPQTPPAAGPWMPPPAAPMAAPVPPPAPQALAPDAETEIPMTPDQVAEWWGRVEQADEAKKPHAAQWEALLRAYLPPDASMKGGTVSINSNIHFRNTEQKKSTIYNRDPKLVLFPLEPLADKTPGPDGQMHTKEDITSIKQAVLNKLLGRDGVNLKRLCSEVLFDILQVAGFGATVIGYERDLMAVDSDPDPVTGLVTKGVPVPVYEEWVWDHLSLLKLLIPHDFKSLRFDKAPWLGYKFTTPLDRAKREYKLPDDFESNASADQAVFKATNGGRETASTTSPMVEGVVIWYYTAYFDAEITHRQLMRRLVLIKGLTERAARHTKSPYQALQPDGRLTQDSMIGNPIHIFTLRDLPDSAYVPSDAAMTDPLVRQENTWASQDIALRDANIPRFLFDESIKEAIAKLQDAAVGEGAAVETGKLARGIEGLIAAIPHLEKAVADVQGRAAIRQTIAETLGLGANQGGSVNDKVLSATEISSANATANVRTKGEQSRFMDDLLIGIRKYDALVVRFADQADYVAWEGADGAKRLSAWNGKMLAPRFAYDIVPDSQLDIDLAQKRQQDIQFTNLLANAPEANRTELLRDLARDFGKDPSKLIQAPPAKQPDQPTMNLSLSPADFIGPQAPIAAEFMRIAGTPISPQALQAAGQFAQVWAAMQAQQQQAQQPAATETEHGGALEGSGEHQPLSKHAADVSGNPVGRGAM